MKYPEMVRYFKRKYNPREESLYDFVKNAKRGHSEFLRKRGWSDEEINLAWAEIIASLSRKRARFVKYREELRNARPQMPRLRRVKARP